jgi:hypothetical protein
MLFKFKITWVCLLSCIQTNDPNLGLLLIFTHHRLWCVLYINGEPTGKKFHFLFLLFLSVKCIPFLINFTLLLHLLHLA